MKEIENEPRLKKLNLIKSKLTCNIILSDLAKV